MKKKLSLCIMVAVVAAVCVYYVRADKQVVSDLMLENVEALAASEGGNIYCVGIGSVDCPIDHTKVQVVLRGYSLE